MAYEHKPGQGTLGKAKEKKKETSPDMSGKIKLLDGREYWLSGWIKKASNGGEFYSLSIGQEVQAYGGGGYSQSHTPFPPQDAHNQGKSNGFSDLDEDIPFN